MQVQVNTGPNVPSRDALERWATETLEDALERFRQEVTRVEVHFSDENSNKGGSDQRCVMEARLAGHEPVAVRHDAATMDEAFRGACDRLKHALGHAMDRTRDKNHRDRASIRRDDAPADMSFRA